MDNINKAKQGFEASFAQAEFYNRQTQDDKHLERILNSLSINAGDMVLDLGTGSGYLAFAIAKAFPQANIIGLDIVTETLKQNKIRADGQNINNISFLEYNGVALPFGERVLDWIVTRYALHHFPDICHAFSEMSRVLKLEGKLFISDPTPDALDGGRFVDNYMQLKDDGHNKFYTIDEYKALANKVGMRFQSKFMSVIRFPRKNTSKYKELLQQTGDEIKALYQIEIQDDECYITEDVLNIIFVKD